MKKIAALLLALMLMAGLCACAGQKPDHAVNLGVEQAIVDDETVKVLSAQLQDKTVTVVLDLECDELKLSDFEEISVRKTGDGAPAVKCDLLRSRELNEAEIYYRPCKGKVTLVFSGETLSADRDLADYCLYLEYQGDDGTAEGFRFALG